MRANPVHLLLLLPLLLLAPACTPGEGDEGNVAEAAQNLDVAPECWPDTIRLEKANGASIALNYDKGRLMSFHIVSGEGEMDTNHAVELTYNDEGQLVGMARGKGNPATPVSYTPEGKLAAIGSMDMTGGGIQPRTYETDEQGRITKEVVLFQGEPYGSRTYIYTDEDPLPDTMQVADRKGELQKTVAFTWGEAPNPFRGVTVPYNPYALIYGYPVGHAPRNLALAVETFVVKPGGTINGKTYEAGDTIHNNLMPVYDAKGMLSSVRGGELSVSYRCQDQ